MEYFVWDGLAEVDARHLGREGCCERRDIDVLVRGFSGVRHVGSVLSSDQSLASCALVLLVSARSKNSVSVTSGASEGLIYPSSEKQRWRGLVNDC